MGLCSHPDQAAFRYTVLLFNCFLTFGSYYCFDMPTVLEDKIKVQILHSWAASDANTFYNLFYTVYAWTNCVMSLIAGVLVDKYGTRFCSVLFLMFCLVGQSFFAFGALVDSDQMSWCSDKNRYVIMFVGRFVFGLGGGSITIVQNTITAKYFTGKELALAFGVTLTAARIGSVVNYDSTSAVYSAFSKMTPRHGLGLTLSMGVGLILISLLSALGFILMDRYADGFHFDEDMDEDEPKKSRKIDFGAIREFTGVYWLLAITITVFYCCVFPFQAIVKDFFKSKWSSYTDSAASVRSSLVYFMSMIISPFLGGAVDWFGHRGELALFGSFVTIPVFIVLNFTRLDPIFSMCAFGISYSVCAAALWPSIQFVVPFHVVGSANGIATSLQMLGIGISNIIVGVLKDKYSYKQVLIFFTAMGVFAFICSMSLICVDRTGVLRRGKRDGAGYEIAEEKNVLTTPLSTQQIQRTPVN